MAEQNQTAYEKAKGNYFLYQTYVLAKQQIKDEGYPHNLPDLAARVVIEEGKEKGVIDEDLVESLSKSTNFPALSGFVKPGVERFGRNHREDFGKDNLERIIQSTPEEKLQANLLDIVPEENSKYQNIVELHRETNEMIGNLNAYSSKEDSKEAQGSRIKASENIKQKVFGYFEEIYSPSFVNALIGYTQSPDGAQIVVNKYIRLAEQKTMEFHDKVKGKEVEYTEAVLSEKDAPAFYGILFRSDAAEEAQKEN